MWLMENLAREPSYWSWSIDLALFTGAAMQIFFHLWIEVTIIAVFVCLRYLLCTLFSHMNFRQCPENQVWIMFRVVVLHIFSSGNMVVLTESARCCGNHSVLFTADQGSASHVIYSLSMLSPAHSDFFRKLSVEFIHGFICTLVKKKHICIFWSTYFHSLAHHLFLHWHCIHSNWDLWIWQ